MVVGDLPQRLGENLERRAVIEQAKGFIAVERAISLDAAYDTLCDRAQRWEIPLDVIAARVLQRTLTI
jgi:AmiR/NasT family two-component response regulator